MMLIKRFWLGMVVVSLVGSMIFSGCKGQKKKEAQPPKTEQAATFKPLDTNSKKVVAKYNGGEITEGELNTYINMVMFFTPQLSALVSDKTKMNQFMEDLARDFSGQKYMASKVPQKEVYSKKAKKFR
jgi:foldase protein PrsA